jgi:hypothetical protein
MKKSSDLNEITNVTVENIREFDIRELSVKNVE